MTSPPRPPLPPSGPPSGLNFSRLTEATPCPPSPAATCSTTRSTNVVMGGISLGGRFDPDSRWGRALGLTHRRGGPAAGPPLRVCVPGGTPVGQLASVVSSGTTLTTLR